MPLSDPSGLPSRILAVLQQHETAMLRYARRITGDDDAARDVVQDTFLKLCRGNVAVADGHLVEWLYTVCRNGALDYRRKERRMTPMDQSTLPLPDTRDREPSLAAEEGETTQQLLSLLDQLPPPEQEAIRLKFQQGLTYREIGGVMGLPVSHVGYLLHHGLQTLRKQLACT